MSSFQRFISTKAYEWKRKQMRTQAKREKLDVYENQSNVQKYTIPIKKPQIIGFSVGQEKQNPIPRGSKKRARAYQEEKIKKLIGIVMIIIGVTLMLRQCFNKTETQEVVAIISNQVIAGSQLLNTHDNHYQVILQDFTNNPDLIEKLMIESSKQEETYAHTFAVWALQLFHTTIGADTYKKEEVGKDFVAFGRYEDGKMFFKQFINDLKVFPIQKGYQYTYENGWKQVREYGGNRKHYGIDLMGKEKNIPIVSMCDGIVERIGWNELGGYRVGIRSKGGAYFYYAHMKEEPKNLKMGDYVNAGDCIGVVGDTGYGVEGTRGKFEEHLHFGIAVVTQENAELWINPYGILKFLEDKTIKEML